MYDCPVQLGQSKNAHQSVLFHNDFVMVSIIFSYKSIQLYILEIGICEL